MVLPTAFLWRLALSLTQMVDLWLPSAWTAASQITVNAWLMRATQAHPNRLQGAVWAAEPMRQQTELGCPGRIPLSHPASSPSSPEGTPPPPTHDLDSISCFPALSELHRLVTGIISREEEAGTGWRPD